MEKISKMRNKKGMSLSLNYIVVAVIVITVAIIVIFGFKNMFSQEADTISDEYIGKMKDSDNDGVPDFMDKCPGEDDEECEKDKSQTG